MKSNVEELIYRGTPDLETERLILRQMRRSDVEDVHRYASDPLVARYVTWEPHESLEATMRYIDWSIEKCARDEVGEWGIELKETGRIIGAIGFINMESFNACGTIGFELSSDYWNKGIMTEALNRLIDFCFDEMGMNRIDASHIPGNDGSRKVLEKVGMQYEGLLRERFMAGEKFYSAMQYAIIRSDRKS